MHNKKKEIINKNLHGPARSLRILEGECDTASVWFYICVNERVAKKKKNKNKFSAKYF